MLTAVHRRFCRERKRQTNDLPYTAAEAVLDFNKIDYNALLNYFVFFTGMAEMSCR